MITDKQFEFLLAFHEKSASGSKYSESRVEAAKLYVFDRDAWSEIKPSSKGDRDEYYVKSYGKKLSEKILFWHEFLAKWPGDIESKFKALLNTGGKMPSQNAIDATIQHVKTGHSMHKCAIDNECFMQSVKSALAKIKKFDDAAKLYNEI